MRISNLRSSSRGLDEKCKTYCAIDGLLYHVGDADIYVLERNVQTLYSAHNEFKQFRQAAIKGDARGCKRFELGSKYATICTGGEENAERLFGTDEPEPEKETPGKAVEEDKTVGQVGNNDKALEDAKHELGLQNVIGLDPPEPYIQGDSGGDEGGGGMIIVAAALVALYLMAA